MLTQSTKRQLPASVRRETPVIRMEHLRLLGDLHWGISTHRGVLVVWDEDHDTRVLQAIDETFMDAPPLAVGEHKGTLLVLWASEEVASRCAQKDLMVDADYWVAYHYFREGNDVFELRLF